MATLSRAEARKERARKGQARAMAGRKCPECGRGNALSRLSSADGVVSGKVCRYCGYERTVIFDGP